MALDVRIMNNMDEKSEIFDRSMNINSHLDLTFICFYLITRRFNGMLMIIVGGLPLKIQ